ncbi:MAG TPA: OmpA family protein [Steroidobacteraceae bacterium]|jgi:outer membrane protein OmpA-like peptidoglycan-associated protein|nr:OmpA family protein [Steroidobacteraceae bacterium]
MNITNYPFARALIGAAVAAVLFAGCASTPEKPIGSEQVRAKLTALQGEPALANRAPVAIKDAEVAVREAEISQKDLVLAAHRVYLADRKVDTARALAETRSAEESRTALNQLSEKARLDSRTREVDVAKSDAANARAESAEQKLAANASEQQAAELQRQLEILQAKPTDRGLVLTLGDTLFATGKSEIKSGATANLDRLTAFMNEYPKRTASIEGFTDSMGSEEMNQSLSQRRADAVKGYLVGQGVGSARLSTSGRGENSPVADNESAAGRQQNRRVEVVISPIE